MPIAVASQPAADVVEDLDGLRDRVAALEAENALLRRRRRYGLVWEDQDEDQLAQARRRLPVLAEDVRMRVGDGEQPHILIEGDNFHSLLGLTYSHSGQVDVIYIDPPYNTGRGDFIYNDRFVGEDDAFRHSKWLSFMAPRLEMARDLLAPNGLIFASIDDNEVHHLRCLMDQIFGERNFVAQLVWKSKSGGANDSSLIAVDHEYVLVYARRKPLARILFDSEGSSTASFKLEDERGRYYLERLDKQNLTYSKSMDYDLEGPDGQIYKLTHKDPARPNAIWRWSASTVAERMDELVFKDGQVYTKCYEKTEFKPRSLLVDERFGRSRTGKADLTSALGTTNAFSYPKPVKFVKWLLGIAANPDAVVLDFFAGSGTTGQAVLELNAQDGGTRRFILCTDDQNAICRDVTYPRLRNVIAGHSYQKRGKKVVVPASGGSLRFFQSNREYVEHSDTPDTLRRRFRAQSTDLLRLREDCYEQLAGERQYAIFRGAGRLLGVLYRERSRDELLAALREHDTGTDEIVLYAFSLDGVIDGAPFTAALGDRVELRSVPDELIHTYQRLFRRTLYGGWA